MSFLEEKNYIFPFFDGVNEIQLVYIVTLLVSESQAPCHEN